MSSRHYEPVSSNDNDDPPVSQGFPQRPHAIPDSPPPSFRSRESSVQRRNRFSEQESLVSEVERTLADAFDSPSDDESGEEGGHGLDERQRVLSGRPLNEGATQTETSAVETRITRLPGFAPTSSRVYGGGNADGVFANLSAKPERNEEADEKPPSYEVAAADATPPYWETTILAPGGTHSADSVFIDGLPVGSVFSFVWNGLISMSFQLVGFLLTYLLHTTHAAKNGSKAGLGITLVQYGFSLRVGGPDAPNAPPPGTSGDFITPPSDPNAHDFDPSGVADAAASAFASDPGAATGGGAAALQGVQPADVFAYVLMVAGWFILIRSISEYLKARRHEQLVLQSPSRGLTVPVVAEDEAPATAV